MARREPGRQGIVFAKLDASGAPGWVGRVATLI